MNKTQEMVSVIVPAFNAASYVAGAMISTLNQTYQNIEIIFVDDASSDETVEIVKALNDNRIRLIRHDCNRGPGAARNTGISAARGRWLTFLDADDQMQPDRLQRLVDAVLLAGEGFFVADDEWECRDQPGVLIGFRRHLNSFELDFKGQEYLDLGLLAYQRAGCPHLHGLVPADVVKSNGIRFPIDCFLGEDLEFYSNLFRLGLRLRLLANAGYMYRVTPDSLSRNPSRIRDMARVCQRLAGDDRFGIKERRYFALKGKRLGQVEAFLCAINLFRAGRRWAGLAYAILHPVAAFEGLQRLPNAIRRCWKRVAQRR